MNDRIYIEGGHQLQGKYSDTGLKKCALPMNAASLLHRGVSVLKGCPRIADVFCMEEILQKLGAVTWWEDHDLYMDCENAGKWSVPFEFTGRMRSSRDSSWSASRKKWERKPWLSRWVRDREKTY